MNDNDGGGFASSRHTYSFFLQETERTCDDKTIVIVKYKKKSKERAHAPLTGLISIL